MQRFDDQVRQGQDALVDGRILLRNVEVLVRRNGRKEVVVANKHYNFDASRCKPVYIDET